MKNWRTFSLKSLLIITTLSAVLVAYRIYQFEHGVINRWIDAVLVSQEANPLRLDAMGIYLNPEIGCQDDIPSSQQIQLLRKSLRWLPTDERRNCVLKIIAEQFPDKAHDLFIQTSKETKNNLVLRNTILLSSLFRIEEDITHYETFLDHQSDLVRSAAVDAIGVVHNPSFPMPAGSSPTYAQMAFASKPQINLREIYEQFRPSSKTKGKRKKAFNNNFSDQAPLSWEDESPRNLSLDAQEKIQQLLENDTSQVVRTAAARACKNWNPMTIRCESPNGAYGSTKVKI